MSVSCCSATRSTASRSPSTGAPAPAPAGPYPIVASAAVGTGLDNYAITYTDGTLTVGNAGLVITADGASKTYGDTVTFSGTEFRPPA